MDFRTELILKPSSWSINLKDPILTIGSCFAQSIGQRLLDNKFPVSVNPFGTTYHPLSIHKLLQYASFQEYPTDHTFLENNNIHFNYNFHSEFNGLSRSELQNQLQQIIASVHYRLKDCKVLILTYGTSWIYERKDTGESVANCHKMNSALFTKRLTNPEEIKESLENTFKTLKSINPDLKIILTISPVRHIKDTLELNSLSKSILRVACHQLSEKYEAVKYFPAFEIMMDDLRDYRFYKNDLIHPTEMAEDYIWDKFSACYFNQQTINFLNQWKEIKKALSHRSFHPSSNSHQKFLHETLTRLEELKSDMDVQEEINQIKLLLVIR